MKVAGRTLDEEGMVARVRQAVHEISGVPLKRIEADTGIFDDLRVYGDDGHELIARLDSQFEMDWDGFDLGIHFGWEGLGAPLPWRVRQCPGYFEHQPLTVRQLADALRRGRWPGTPRLPRSKARRIELHIVSWVQFGLVAGAALMVVALLLASALGG
jgi:hypothetical protein